MEVVWLSAGALLLAYANGANDNFKGVATLFGSGTLRYRTALAWATTSTFLGSLVSLYLARSLVRAFTGKGLVPDAVAAEPGFLASVGLGAGVTVLGAALLGVPISTTHALVGGLLGSGLVWASGGVDPTVLGGVFLLPLLVSPVLAAVGTRLVYPILRATRLRLGVERETCVCLDVEGQPQVVPVQAPVEPGAVVLAATPAGRTLEVVVDQEARCVERYRGRLVGVPVGAALDAAHVASAGALGFARGLNDTPKIAALLVAAPAVGLPAAVGVVAAVVALGGLLNARRVAETMSHRVTPMNAGQGFTGNAVSALLVIVASRFGVPVSTTHVTCGALFGIGLATGGARWRTIGGIVLAWIATLPAAAALGAAASWVLGGR